MTKISGKGVKTFSVGFAEQKYNEIEYARIAASHYHAEPHECFVSADDALEVLPLLAAQFDEPFGNSSAIPTYFCLQTAKQAGVELMLAGDGGDELFGGNERYLEEKWFLPYDVLPPRVRALTTRMGASLPRVFPLRKIRRYIERASEPNPGRFFHYQLLFLSALAADLLKDDFRAQIEPGFALRMPEYHYRNAGTAFYKARAYDKAVTVLSKAIELNPRDAQAYSLRAFCRAALGDQPGAAEDRAAAARLKGEQQPVVATR